MRRVAALVLALGVLMPASAGASGALTYPKARAKAQAAAAARARRQTNITSWEVKRGFRFTSTKWVFVWYGQLSNGQGCAAQLVVRFASTKTTKAVTYFRNETCS